LDHGYQVDAACFDFKKAFDLVDNDILLQKLALVGFTAKLLSFFSSYPSNRQQFVRVAGYESDKYYTLSGVSQGSTLGPTLCLILINYPPTTVSVAQCLLFTSDLKLSLVIEDVADTYAL
jgi:hypothetical protein